MTERKIALSQAYLGIKHRIDCSEKDFINSFNNWKIFPAKYNDLIVGCLMVLNNEVHISINPKFKGKFNCVKIYREAIEKIIKEYGIVKTKSMKNSLDSIKFIKRIGFKEVGENEYMYFYEKKEE